jgi:type I restriction enzyme S subunit
MCKRILSIQTQVEGDVPFYKIGTIGSQPDAYISHSLFEEYKNKYNYPRKGEILISCAGTVGKCVIFNGKPSYYQDSNIVWVRNYEHDFSNSFLNYILIKQNWKKLNSTTIVRIYNDDLRDLSFNYPSLIEQAKITSLLNLLDRRISTQSKIIREIQSLIKGLASNLTNKGKKEIQISDCLECHTSTLQENTLNDNGCYPVYGASGISGYTNNADIHGESILIIKDGSSVGSVSYVNRDYSVIGTLNFLTAKKGFNLRYLYFALKVFDFIPYKTGMAIPHIYFKDYGKAKIYCPTIEEQNHIANTLAKLEDNLLINQNLLSLFQSQKRYLLHQMFI